MAVKRTNPLPTGKPKPIPGKPIPKPIVSATRKPKNILPTGKPTISANVAAGRKPKVVPKSIYVSPSKISRKPRSGM